MNRSFKLGILHIQILYIQYCICDYYAMLQQKRTSGCERCRRARTSKNYISIWFLLSKKTIEMSKLFEQTSLELVSVLKIGVNNPVGVQGIIAINWPLLFCNWFLCVPQTAKYSWDGWIESEAKFTNNSSDGNSGNASSVSNSLQDQLLKIWHKFRALSREWYSGSKLCRLVYLELSAEFKWK